MVTNEFDSSLSQQKYEFFDQCKQFPIQKKRRDAAGMSRYLINQNKNNAVQRLYFCIDVSDYCGQFEKEKHHTTLYIFIARGNIPERLNERSAVYKLFCCCEHLLYGCICVNFKNVRSVF